MTDSAEKVEERRYLRRENCLEVNNRNSLNSNCHPELTAAFKSAM